jgi:proline dehydrogenase
MEICEAAVKQGSRVWIDAEQQDLQNTIDEWSINLMRKFNTGEKALVYTTMQAYLKHTPDNIARHLRLAQDEGWVLGIKLVRGAYIATEKRELIHDTIEDTHKAYNTVAENLLKQAYPGIQSNKPYPRAELFLATHNPESIKLGWSIQQSLMRAKQPTVELGFGQLQGMADEISCSLLQLCQQGVQTNQSVSQSAELSPNVFKCLAWGSTQECLQFLLRRVRENADALGRTRSWAMGFKTEIGRRLRGGN